ncbi:MAG: FCD domain-containing protein [Chloroflexota bacterium]
MPAIKLSSDFLRYLASLPSHGEDEPLQRLPTLNELSGELGVSVAKLREQVEAAKTLGFISVQPRTGIQRLTYSFYPAVQQSLAYACALDWRYFELFYDLRYHIEATYFHQAVQVLQPDDLEKLQSLLHGAREKLRGHPIQIPHLEHRELHLSIYRRLENPFVSGLLEAYWDVYEAVGLNLYAAHDYLEQVWAYHERMVTSLCGRDVNSAYQALVEHVDLFSRLPKGGTPLEVG